MHQNEIKTSLQSLKLNQSELKCVIPPGILVCIYISKHDFKTKLIKHKFEHTVGIIRDKQHIVINCLEICQNYFSNVTKSFLSNAQINLETYNKKPEGTARNITLCFYIFMLFFKHNAVPRALYQCVATKQSSHL